MSYNHASVVYGLKHQARAMVAQLGETEYHRFFLGTNTVREPNEIHWIEFSEDSNEIHALAVLPHESEIWSLATTSSHPDLITSCYAHGTTDVILWSPVYSCFVPEKSHLATVWKMEDAENKVSAERPSHLKRLIDLTGHELRLKSVIWNPDDASSIVTIADDAVKLWKIDGNNGVLSAPATSFTGFASSETGCFDPHHSNQFASVHDRTIRLWDFRTQKETHVLEDAHSQLIRDIDYNPNKLHHLVTASNDRRIKFWDARHLRHPLKILTGHTHWVFAAKFNRFHDQLLASGGSDAQVNLWSLLSVSSAPLGDLEDHSAEAVRDGDKLVRSFDENEDSVYAVAWSAADAWIFASLSYDGRCVVHHVPPPEKYKILL